MVGRGRVLCVPHLRPLGSPWRADVGGDLNESQDSDDEGPSEPAWKMRGRAKVPQGQCRWVPRWEPRLRPVAPGTCSCWAIGRTKVPEGRIGGSQDGNRDCAPGHPGRFPVGRLGARRCQRVEVGGSQDGNRDFAPWHLGRVFPNPGFGGSQLPRGTKTPLTCQGHHTALLWKFTVFVLLGGSASERSFWAGEPLGFVKLGFSNYPVSYDTRDAERLEATRRTCPYTDHVVRFFLHFVGFFIIRLRPWFWGSQDASWAFVLGLPFGVFFPFWVCPGR